MIARIALFLASPDLVRYSGDLSSRAGADYSFWPIGPLIPPLNPEVIEAAEAEEAPFPPDPPGPQDSVPIAVVGISTPQPVATDIPSPTPSPTPSATVATAQPPTTTALPPSPTATRTVVVQQAPTNPPPAPARTAAPSATAAAPSATPVTAPAPPVPTNTRQPSPTSTQAPPVPTSTRTPVVATATPPVVGTPVPPPATATPSPTTTPEPPRLAFANVAPIVGEAESSVRIYLQLNKAFEQPVSVSYATADGSARAGADYVSKSGILTIAVGQTEGFIDVPILADTLDERSETFTLTLADPVTNAILEGAGVATITITDGTAPPTLRFAGSSRSVDESVGSAALTIELSAASAIDVSVPYRVGSGETAAGRDDHGLRDGTAIIPAGTTSARLRFPIVNDEIDEDNEPITIYLGTPTNAQLGAPSIYALTIVDNDTAGVAISPRQFNLAEGGAATSYSVVLESQPVAEVVITLAPDAQVAVAPVQLTFTPASWKTPQSVSLSAVQDFVDEAAVHPGRVSHSVRSADPRYDNVAAAAVQAAITDDDTAGVVIEPADEILDLSEDPGAFDHRRGYSVVLESQPVAPVSIAIALDGQVTANRVILQFTAADWNQEQTVLLTAVDDFVDEITPHASQVLHTATSADPNYAGIAVPRVLLRIADNDTAGLQISPDTLTVSERTPSLIHSDIYTLRLESQPTANVMVEVSFDSKQIESVTPSELLFTPANWNLPQRVVVTALNDKIDEVEKSDTNRHFSRIDHTIASADPNYHPPTAPFSPGSVVVTILDDDFAGVRVIPTSRELTVAEGGVITYSVELETEPVASVAVQLSFDAGLLDAAPTPLSFTADTWDVPQTVTVTAADNFVDAPDARTTIGHITTSADPLYDTPAPPFIQPNPVVSVTITDNDTAGVLVTPTSLELAEPDAANDEGSYAVRLASEPTAPVTLTLDLDTTQLVSSTASLVFTPENWDDPQDVTISVVDDDIDEEPQTTLITHTIASADGVYAALPASEVPAVTVTIADNDEAGVALDPVSLNLSESLSGTKPHSTTVSLQLESQPTGLVTVTLVPDAQLTVAPATLVFDPLLWEQPQTVTITAVDDAVDETTPHTGTLTVSTSSADPFYQGALSEAAYPVLIEDDDTAGVTLGGSSGLVTTEGGGSITFTLRLDSQPLVPVRLDVVSDTPSEGVVSDPTQPLVFDATTWNITQTVMVTGVDDLLPDGNRPYQVLVAVAEGSDAAYMALAPDNLPMLGLINQDDEPVLADVGDPAMLSEGDAGLRALRFPVTLRRPTTAPVAIDYTTFELDARAGSDFQPLAGTLTLAAGEISGNIDVFVIGDTEYEPDELFGVRLTAARTTGDLTGLGDAEAIGVIRNDDDPRVRFATNDLLVAENVGTVTIEVRLDAPVDNPVNVGYTTIDSGVLAGSATVGVDYLGLSGVLQFAPGEVSKTIVLTVLDDDLLAEARYETLRIGLLQALTVGAPIGQPDVIALTIEEDGLTTPFSEPGFLATAGPRAEMIHGYWYTSAAAGSGSDYLQLTVPCSWPAGQPLTVELWSAAIHTGSGSLDIALEPAARAEPDTTIFELYDAGTPVGLDGRSPTPGASGSLFAQTFLPTNAPAGWEPLFTVANPQPCGRYVLRSATSDDDENSWAVRANLAGAEPVRFATLLNTVEQSSATGVQACRTAWLAVPAGTNELRLRNFDLDTSRDSLANLRYYAPGEVYDALGRLGGQAGTESGEARWAEDSVVQPAAGWWRAVICTSGRNLHTFDAQADGVLLAVQYDTPPPAPALELAVGFAPAIVGQGEPATLSLSYAVSDPSSAREVVLRLELTSELAFVGEPCAVLPWPCTRTGNMLTLTAGDLAAGSSGDFALPVQVSPGLVGQRAAALLFSSYADTFGIQGRAEAVALLAIQ